MKKFILLLFFVYYILPVSAYSSVASKYVEKEYENKYRCKNIHINMKKEYKNEYNLKIGKNEISAIIYGWGDMKIKGCKKNRITYVVLLNQNCKPFWNSIIFYN